MSATRADVGDILVIKGDAGTILARPNAFNAALIDIQGNIAILDITSPLIN